MLIKLKQYILLHILCIVGFLQVGAQDRRYYFETLDIHKGLSQNTVNTVIQDHFGFMWFGTKDGVNRYDGLDFRVFKQKIGDKNGLKSNLKTETILYGWVRMRAYIYIILKKNRSQLLNIGLQTARSLTNLLR